MAVNSTSLWRNEIVKQFRYPGRVQMIMEISPNILKSDVAASAENALSITSVASTLDDRDPTFMEVATMEGIWRADGTMYLPSRDPEENMDLPLWSDSLISEESPLVLDYRFDQEVSFVGLTFAWDRTYSSWPTKLQLYGYASNGSVKYSIEVSDIKESFSELEYPMDEVIAIRAVVSEWSKPNLRARVSEIYFGVMLEFTDKQILNISENTKQSYMSSELPVDTQKYSIKNQVYRVYAAGAGTATSNKSHPLTDVSRIFNAAAELQGLATVETRYWKADGTMYLPSRVVQENPDIPWMSADGAFSSSDPIEVVITYEHPVQINTINLTWDTVSNSWPIDASVAGQDSYGNIVFSRDITASSVSTQVTDIVATVKSVHLYIRKWSREGWRARIGQYEALLMYGNNSIPSEVNNLFDPTLEAGYSKYLARRQKVRVRYGLDTYNMGTLWLPEQVRYLDSWDIPTDAIKVDFQASTRLSFLTQEYQRGRYSSIGTSFKALALDILTHSNMIKDGVNPTPWVLDDVLGELYTKAPVPALPENALLQLIANATGCVLSTEPTTGYVLITRDIPDSEYIIDSMSQQQVPGVTLEPPLRSIAVKMYNYTVKSDTSELFTGTVTFRGTKKVTVHYANNICATNCVAEVVGAEILSYTFYGYSAVFELAAPNVETDVAITITGQQVESSNVQITTYLDPDVESGREIVIDNMLITNVDTLNIVAQRALEFYKRRNTVSTKYLGYPDLKAGDRSALYSQYLNENGFITEHTLEYNGAYSGNLKMIMEV